MKINSFARYNLPNDTHFQFYTELLALYERYKAGLLNFEQLFLVLFTLYGDEDTALKKIAKSSLTADLQDADRFRDELWRAMVYLLKAALLHYDREVRKAAAHIKIVFDTYGDVTRKSLDDESSAIYNFLQDMRGKYLKDATKAGLAPEWLDEAETANTTVSTLMRERYGETAAQTDIAMKTARLRVDDAYSNIVDCINAAILMEGKEKYREFVTELNVIIKRYADIQAQRKGRAAAKKEKKEEE
jgi:hypothetical protein